MKKKFIIIGSILGASVLIFIMGFTFYSIWWLRGGYNNTYVYQGRTYHLAQNVTVNSTDNKFFHLLKDDARANSYLYAATGFSEDKMIVIEPDKQPYDMYGNGLGEGVYLSDEADDNLSFIKSNKLSLSQDTTQSHPKTLYFQSKTAHQFISAFEKLTTEKKKKEIYSYSDIPVVYDLTFYSSMNPCIVSRDYSLGKEKNGSYLLLGNNSSNTQTYADLLSEEMNQLLTQIIN